MQRALSGDLSASEIIALLHMQPHPEGGHYVETFRDPAGPEGRGFSTSIYFLLQAGEVSAWHRVDAAEHWFWHTGGPLALSISEDGRKAYAHRLGPDLRAGQKPQAVVPAGAWQAAESLGAWTLVSCVVAPGFLFERFELAHPDWFPGKPE
ncbi:cupin domain-containing protein [Aquidulcibacter paucihalophilus]|uniref:cupin domain-containing protein n=1 Tax=Aquidulcibacter paucihalophilus TaxID=1978549 RepID=UPI000A1946EB|nr:cupin domain-containing protein [Aquidulcibacter paucihalophilus]